jgi:outer membrane lipoprotein-sorting protein
MSRFRFAAIALALFALSLSAVALVHAQETDLKALIKKSIDAHGGEEAAKFNAAVVKYKGTVKEMGMTFDITGENSLLKPDKLRVVSTVNINGKSLDITTVFDGKTLWISFAGNTKEINDPKIIDDMKQSLMTEVGAGLGELTKPGFEISAIGEAKVKGKDTFGIRVSKKGQRDISYYLDKKTHLLVKIESRSINPANGQEVTQEKIILEYVDKNNMKTPKRIEILKDGEPYADLEITDLQVHEKLDMSLFAKP